jgi:hypothetical protein
MGRRPIQADEKYRTLQPCSPALRYHSLTVAAQNALPSRDRQGVVTPGTVLSNPAC